MIISACHVLVAKLLSGKTTILYSHPQCLKVPHLGLFKKLGYQKKKLFSFVCCCVLNAIALPCFYFIYDR